MSGEHPNLMPWDALGMAQNRTLTRRRAWEDMGFQVLVIGGHAFPATGLPWTMKKTARWRYPHIKMCIVRAETKIIWGQNQEETRRHLQNLSSLTVVAWYPLKLALCLIKMTMVRLRGHRGFPSMATAQLRSRHPLAMVLVPSYPQPHPATCSAIGDVVTL